MTTGRGESPTVLVGEPLVLRARRTSGPWRLTPEPPLAGCGWSEPPPEVEPEVADNVRWRALPDEAAAFNVAYREDRTREVRFSAPGEYLLTAESSPGCGGSPSLDSLTVRVVAP